jgi:hypothetical protein
VTEVAETGPYTSSTTPLGRADSSSPVCCLSPLPLPSTAALFSPPPVAPPSSPHHTRRSPSFPLTTLPSLVPPTRLIPCFSYTNLPKPNRLPKPCHPTRISLPTAQHLPTTRIPRPPTPLMPEFAAIPTHTPPEIPQHRGSATMSEVQRSSGQSPRRAGPVLAARRPCTLSSPTSCSKPTSAGRRPPLSPGTPSLVNRRRSCSGLGVERGGDMHCKTLKVTPFLRREEAVPAQGSAGLGFWGLLAALPFLSSPPVLLVFFLWSFSAW